MSGDNIIKDYAQDCLEFLYESKKNYDYYSLCLIASLVQARNRHNYDVLHQIQLVKEIKQAAKDLGLYQKNAFFIKSIRHPLIKECKYPPSRAITAWYKNRIVILKYVINKYE